MQPTYEGISDDSSGFPFRCFWNHSEGRSEWVHPHWHDSVEILLVESGEAIQQVNDRTFRLSPGDIACIPGGAVHATTACGPSRCAIRVFQFPSALGEAAGFASGTRLPLRLQRQDSGYEGFASDLRSLAHEWDRRGPGVERMCRAHLLTFHARAERRQAMEDGRVAAERALPVEAPSRAMLTRTFRWIDEAYSGTLTLSDAARRSNLSVAQFCRLFRRATGRSFQEYLTAYRMDRAVRRLLDTGEERASVAEVARACGFGSVFSMIRAFKEAYGCTPSAFRARNRSEGPGAGGGGR